jgi:hypothetical protein
MGVAALLAAVALAGCDPIGTAEPPVATPTGPLPVVTMRTRRDGADERGLRWEAYLPVLAGLAPDATARANEGLAALYADLRERAHEFRVDDGDAGPMTYRIEPELARADERYVTVVVRTYYDEVGGRPGLTAVQTYVVERATGSRVTLGSLLEREAGARTLVAMSGHLHERLPVVLGGGRWGSVPEVDAAVEPAPARFAAFVPLPEGLAVLVVLGRDDVPRPVSVVVPWRVLGDVVVAEPPAGDADPEYVDGRLPDAGERGPLAAAAGPGAERVLVSQVVGDEGWALAQRGFERLVLRRGVKTVQPQRWRVVDRGPHAGCASLPEPVRASFALRCPD